MKYIPRLDSFRAIAALLIVYLHYFADLLPPAWHLDTSFGVSFFFVLSGFLITEILLEDSACKPPRVALLQFYIRRTFRIFPLYYFVLLFGLTLNVSGFWTSLPWSPLYLVNFGILKQGSLDNFGYLSHFWTLAIEEQFYIFWPLIVLSVKRRDLWMIAIAVVAASMLFRLYVAFSGISFFYNLTILGLGDHLALGAIGAIACKQFGAKLAEKLARWALVLGIPALAYWPFRQIYSVSFLWNALWSSAGVTACAFAFLWLVLLAKRDGAEGNSWGGGVLPAIGGISYGIYMWHYVILSFAKKIEELGVSLFLTRCICLSATFAAAWLSYRLFERPLRSIGRKIANHCQSPEAARYR